MFTIYVVAVAMTAIANTFSATCDFTRFEQVAVGMRQVGVPTSWMTMLGSFKLLGALGVVLGIAVPVIGTAAATGLVVFFLAAILTHLRVGDYSPQLGLAAVFLLLAAVTLGLGLATN